VLPLDGKLHVREAAERRDTAQAGGGGRYGMEGGLDAMPVGGHS
jgi:hypothetical protein